MGGQRSFVTLTPRPALATLVLVNADPSRARRFGLLSAQDGAIARVGVPAAGETALVVAAGRYRAVELDSGAADAGRESSEAIELALGARRRLVR